MRRVMITNKVITSKAFLPIDIQTNHLREMP